MLAIALEIKLHRRSHDTVCRLSKAALLSKSMRWSIDIRFFKGQSDGSCPNNSQKRSSPKGVVQNRCSWKLPKLCWKTPMPESFFNKFAGRRPAALLKKKLPHVFSCEFCEISKNMFVLQNTSGGCFWIQNNYFLEMITEGFLVVLVGLF